VDALAGDIEGPQSAELKAPGFISGSHDYQNSRYVRCSRFGGNANQNPYRDESLYPEDHDLRNCVCHGQREKLVGHPETGPSLICCCLRCCIYSTCSECSEPLEPGTTEYQCLRNTVGGVKVVSDDCFVADVTVCTWKVCTPCMEMRMEVQNERNAKKAEEDKKNNKQRDKQKEEARARAAARDCAADGQEMGTSVKPTVQRMAGDIERLQKEKACAIEKEDFELAADIKKQLAALEAGEAVSMQTEVSGGEADLPEEEKRSAATPRASSIGSRKI